jgi:8-oxo-dGTP diphosphatase
MSQELPFKVSVLVFLKDKEGQFLLMHRKKSPNKGLWSPIGGKVETAIGESPFECARREIFEEAGAHFKNEDLHLFGMITEKNYEGVGHWLVFLFEGLKPLEHIPTPIEEGDFAFFSREKIHELQLPATDLKALWPLYDQYHEEFVILEANCRNPLEPIITIEENQATDVRRHPLDL